MKKLCEQPCSIWARALSSACILSFAGCYGGLEEGDDDWSDRALGAVVTIEADAMVKQAAPSTNFGLSTEIGSDGDSGSGNRIASFIKFTVSGIPSGATVVAATLKLKCFNGTDNGPGVLLASNNWSETSVTWNNKPAEITGEDLDNVRSVGAGSTVVYDITSGIAGNGTYTLKLSQSSSSNGMTCYSEEHGTAADRPSINVEYTTSSTTPDSSSPSSSPELDNGPSPSLVPTFHSVGIYWPHASGTNVRATAEYRVVGTSAWKPAQDLAFDGRALGGRPAEYRGSIVNLLPNTEYEVKLNLVGKSVGSIAKFKTWNESLPIAKTITLGNSSTPHTISGIKGTPTGYVLVTGPSGTTIDVANKHDFNILVTNSEYVIIRGLTLKGAKKHGIQLGSSSTDVVNNIVIENNDISGWGTWASDGFGTNLDSAVFSASEKLSRVVVQRNKLHHPRTDSNNWSESRPTNGGKKHPLGPQGITFKRSAGNHVIRYNEIYSDDDHRFNDGMGETNNFSYKGFPGRDSDIYSNFISHVWDDGIEAEGGMMNVRIFNNYLTEVNHAFGLVPVALGPTYVFRNVAALARKDDTTNYGWQTFKMGGDDSSGVYYGFGATYLYHNAQVQAALMPNGGIDGYASDSGVSGFSDDRTLKNLVTRNNILQVGSGQSIDDNMMHSSNSYNFDLFNGGVDGPGQEANGRSGKPTYVSGWGLDATSKQGNFQLTSSSLGFDQGAPLPNFNDSFRGARPDIGAHEAGSQAMNFGVDANFTPE